MPAKKIIQLRGLAELEKLEATGGTQTFKYVVERCNLFLGPRRPVVTQVSDVTAPTAIVKATTHFVVVCQLLQGEVAPDYLPRVRQAYI